MKHHCFLILTSLLLFACQNSDSAKRTAVPSTFQQENKDFIDILYASQTLDELCRILERQDSSASFGYWAKFLQARELRSNGKKGEAISTLRTILQEADASRSKIWTWNALRELNAEIPADVADQALGFVMELPAKNETAYLSGYSDGTIRYLDAATEPVIWDTPVSAFQPHIEAILNDGKLLKSNKKLRKSRSARKADHLKLSFLMPAGIFEIQATPLELEKAGPPLSDIYIRVAAILDIIKKQQ